MGGKGSTRWKMHRKKDTVEQCEMITIAECEIKQGCDDVSKEGKIAKLPDGNEVLLISEDQLFGFRWWIKCPSCNRRVKKLYRPPANTIIACRHCHNLTYHSSQQAHGPSVSDLLNDPAISELLSISDKEEIEILLRNQHNKDVMKIIMKLRKIIELSRIKNNIEKLHEETE